MITRRSVLRWHRRCR